MDFVRRFYVEAKTFKLSMVEGALVLQLEERRGGLSCVAFMGILCTAWLIGTMEELVCNSRTKEFIKSFRGLESVFRLERLQ